MEPNAQQPQVPSPAPSQVPPTNENQPSPPVQVQQPTPTTGLMPSAAAPKKSHTKLIITAVVLVVLLPFIALFLLTFLKDLQVSAASNKFMKAITTKNVDAALVAADTSGDTAGTKQFLTQASTSVNGNYKLSSHEFTSGKGYFLYSLSNEKNKYARTIVEKQSDGWKVTSFVYSPNSLALIPKETTTPNKSTTSTKSTTAPVAQTSTLACLSQDDYKWMNYNKQPDSVTYDPTYDPSKFTNNKIVDMFFKPDSTNEASFLSIYDDWADFASHNVNKEWKLRLQGSTYGADSGTAASKKLAEDRVQKVKTQLASRGVSAERMIAEPPHNYSQEAQDDSKDQIYRRVQVTVDPTCASATSSTTRR